MYTKNNPLLQALLRGTKHNLYICSLANGQGSERRIVTRDKTKIERFLAKFDVAERGCYTCVSTIEGASRNKSAARELPALHVDIDFKQHPEKKIADIHAAVATLGPNLFVYSGNGMHAYWLLKQPLNLTNKRRVEQAEYMLKRLCDLCAGDRAPTHVVALMRLPNTHNTKGGAWKKVECIKGRKERWGFDALFRFLTTVEPVLVRKKTALDYLKEYANSGDYHAPIDVPKRLAEMQHGGEGDSAIHLTQRSCTASLISRGVDIDEVVDVVLDATKAAVGREGRSWNWREEEKKIRRMCESWMVKKAEMDGRNKRRRA
jgi:hypothetical protein